MSSMCYCPGGPGGKEVRATKRSNAVQISSHVISFKLILRLQYHASKVSDLKTRTAITVGLRLEADPLLDRAES